MFWNDGYRTDIEYTFGYYPNLSPTQMRFAALVHGYDVMPESDDDVHLELGVGQGLSANIHAASHKGQYFGNDFNPSHIAFANLISSHSGVQANFTDQSFEELLQRDDIPQCDTIAIHGVWSWISEGNQRFIVEIVKKFLKPGGLFHISYNCSAGHNHFVEWKNRLYRYYSSLSGSPREKAEKTFAHFEEIFTQFPELLKDNPQLKASWNEIKKQANSGNYNYLIHEYLNEHWKPMTLEEVTQYFDAAKLSFVGSMNFNEIIDAYRFSGPVKTFLATRSILDREMWHDTFVKETFRKDLFMKGGYRLNGQQQLDRLREWYFISLCFREELENKMFKSGTMEIKSDLFDPIANCLCAEDYRPKSFAELLEVLPSNYGWNDLLKVLVVKIQRGDFAIVNNPAPDQSVVAKSQQYNNYIIHNLMPRRGINYLASPVLGTGYSKMGMIYVAYMKVVLENPTMNDQEIAGAMFDFMDKLNVYARKENSTESCNREESIELFVRKQIPEAKKYAAIWKHMKFI